MSPYVGSAHPARDLHRLLGAVPSAARSRCARCSICRSTQMVRRVELADVRWSSPVVVQRAPPAPGTVQRSGKGTRGWRPPHDAPEGSQTGRWVARRESVPCDPPAGPAGTYPRREEITTQHEARAEGRPESPAPNTCRSSGSTGAGEREHAAQRPCRAGVELPLKRITLCGWRLDYGTPARNEPPLQWGAHSTSPLLRTLDRARCPRSCARTLPSPGEQDLRDAAPALAVGGGSASGPAGCPRFTPTIGREMTADVRGPRQGPGRASAQVTAGNDRHRDPTNDVDLVSQGYWFEFSRRSFDERKQA